LPIFFHLTIQCADEKIVLWLAQVNLGLAAQRREFCGAPWALVPGRERTGMDQIIPAAWGCVWCEESAAARVAARYGS
jgi:hypothetical protein